MASWRELRSHIFDNYKVAEDGGSIMALDFNTGDRRSQRVMVGLGGNDRSGEEWVQISSPIAAVGEVNLVAAARAAFDWLCGGVVVISDTVYLHHAAPLVNLDLNEFERPLSIVVQGADEIERQLTGVDRY